jgi:hypothetical protein
VAADSTWRGTRPAPNGTMALVALLFASRPTYMKWLNEAQAKYHLRI